MNATDSEPAQAGRQLENPAQFRLSADELDQRLHLNWLDLGFTGENKGLEAAFLASYATRSLAHIRLALVLGISLFAGFGALDALLLPDHKEQIWFIRYALFCPVALAILACTWTRWFVRHAQPTLALFMTYAGLCLTAIIVTAPEPISYSYYAGNILIIIFGYTFVRMRFVWATFAGWVVVAIYEFAAIGLVDTPLEVLINNNFFFISANIIGMFSCYAIEYYARRDFFLVEQLSEQRAAVEAARDDLEVRVQERTRDAMAAARSKSEFLANMSHEIRTPMNGVMGMLDLLRETPLNIEQRDYVETSFRSAEGLLGIINDVLDLSKIEAGKMTLCLDRVTPGDIIEDICAVMYPQAKQKSLELVPLLHPEAFDPCHIDPTRFRQIVLNLVGNAIKFTERGEISVRCWVELADEPEADNRLHVAVTDTGIGIAQEKLATLFEAFAQADASTTRRFGGTGLGLTITRQLVELMQGHIDVTSEPGEGSRFEFAIPVSGADGDSRTDGLMVPTPHHRSVRLSIYESGCAEAVALLLQRLEVQVDDTADFVISDEPDELVGVTAGALIADRTLAASLPPGVVHISAPLRLSRLASALTAQPCAVPEFDGGAERLTLSGARMLLVEDNAVNRRVAGAMLERIGAGHDNAAGGLEALGMVARQSYDLILMDCQMPDMDGFETTAAIRELEHDAGRVACPIIALTANAMSGDRERCLAAGMDDYLAKPVNMRALVRVLGRHLQPVTRQAQAS